MSKRNRTLVEAFSLVPVVEQILPERPKVEVILTSLLNGGVTNGPLCVQVGCLCVWDHCLYVGTQCGMVIYYFLEEHKSPMGKIIFQSKVKGRIQLATEKVG